MGWREGLRKMGRSREKGKTKEGKDRETVQYSHLRINQNLAEIKTDGCTNGLTDRQTDGQSPQ